MIISFGWTTPALLAGRKTVTRREWDLEYAQRFKAGQLVDAWNTSPRNVRGNPHKIATIQLTTRPYQERAREAPDDDWEAEGFAYLTELGRTVNGHTPQAFWHSWKLSNPLLWVVRFEIVELV